ncbi:MAG: acyl-CoA dehydrogenase family protein [Rhodospirillales bacterium]|nr:acyl-CoA dehydrogenase family protein [Rhodospirillales bacterium]
MYSLHLTAEQIEFRDTVRSFAENEIKPSAILPDRLEPFEKPLMKDLLDATSQLGLRTLTLSEDAGGVGADTLTSCIVLEELAAGDIDIAVVLGQTALLGHLLFDKWMTADQREEFLPRFVDSDTFHLGYAGRDVGALTGWSYHHDLYDEPGNEPVAVKQGDDWVIDGSVSFVANAPIAELFVVQVRTDPKKSGPDGLSALLVPRDTPGLTIHEPPKAIGETDVRWHHGCVSGVSFSKCKVPAGNMLGGEGKAPVAGTDYTVRNALQRAAINLGLGRAALDAAVEYTKIRRQGGRMIVGHQAIGQKIADMAIKLEVARTMIWKAAWVADHPEAVADHSVSELPLHIVAGTFTADVVHEVALEAAECFGAMAVMRDMPLQKYVTDGFMFLHSEMNDIATKLQIAESVVDYQRSQAA